MIKIQFIVFVIVFFSQSMKRKKRSSDNKEKNPEYNRSISGKYHQRKLALKCFQIQLYLSTDHLSTHDSGGDNCIAVHFSVHPVACHILVEVCQYGYISVTINCFMNNLFGLIVSLSVLDLHPVSIKAFGVRYRLHSNFKKYFTPPEKTQQTYVAYATYVTYVNMYMTYIYRTFGNVRHVIFYLELKFLLLVVQTATFWTYFFCGRTFLKKRTPCRTVTQIGLYHTFAATQ